jgi:hypothetical protein
MRRLALLFWSSVVVAIATQQVGAADADPLSGTWYLNPGMSRFHAGPAILKQTRTYEVSGDSVKQTVDGVDSAGKPTHSSFTAKYDGKEYPVTGNPDADTISVKRVDKNTARSVLRKNGKVVQTTVRKMGKNGKTVTFKTQGTNAKGDRVDYELVFGKEPPPKE